MVLLTKTTFQRRVSEAATAVKLQRLPGHSICIGSTLEYLLRGLPFDVVKVKGHWNSNAFHQYLRDHAKVLALYMQVAPPDMSRSKAWQDKIYQICQEIRDIKQQTRNKERHILNKGAPKVYYRGKIVSLDTHGGNAMDGVYSDYSIQSGIGSDRNSGIPEHYDTPVYGASPVPPSRSPTPEVPHTPLLIPGSWISEPSSDVGLGRACNADLSQSPSSCVNGPGESDLRIEEGVATRGESSWLERRDSREGQEEGEDPGLGLGEGSSGPSGDLGPSSPPPPNDKKEVTRC